MINLINKFNELKCQRKEGIIQWELCIKELILQKILQWIIYNCLKCIKILIVTEKINSLKKLNNLLV